VTGSGYVWFTVWTDGSAGDTLNVANVEASVVPEPTSVMLVGTGLMGMLIFVRRRKV
jgi:PEP-CTERM motif